MTLVGGATDLAKQQAITNPARNQQCGFSMYHQDQADAQQNRNRHVNGNTGD